MIRSQLKIFNLHGGRANVLPSLVLINIKIPRLRFGLPTLLMSNVTSFSNKTDELITAVRSVKVGVVAITEARQIVPVKCYTENYEQFHHLSTNRRGG